MHIDLIWVIKYSFDKAIFVIIVIIIINKLSLLNVTCLIKLSFFHQIWMLIHRLQSYILSQRKIVYPIKKIQCLHSFTVWSPFKLLLLVYSLHMIYKLIFIKGSSEVFVPVQLFKKNKVIKNTDLHFNQHHNHGWHLRC